MEQGISFSPKAIWDSTSVASKSVIIVLAIMGIYMLAVEHRALDYLLSCQAAVSAIRVRAAAKKLADRDIKGRSARLR